MSHIVVIDPRVEQWSQLAQAWSASAEVVLLDTSDAPLSAMAQLVEARPGTTALHLVAHGRPGCIELGGECIDADALTQQAPALARIGAALGADGEVLLYACQLAAGRTGDLFLDRLAELTGASVSAAATLLGHEAIGAAWTLDAHRGQGTAPMLARMRD